MGIRPLMLSLMLLCALGCREPAPSRAVVVAPDSATAAVWNPEQSHVIYLKQGQSADSVIRAARQQPLAPRTLPPGRAVPAP
jgi:hypothetical protein